MSRSSLALRLCITPASQHNNIICNTRSRCLPATGLPGSGRTTQHHTLNTHALQLLLLLT